MKIIFICGSLEPGKNGVGDYTRRFCAELINQGVSVGILSYNDKDVDSSIEETQHADGKDVLCYRISNKIDSKKRTGLAKKWIDSKNPEWLSLQFVPYSFNLKGMPFGLVNQLKIIGGHRKWHIMVHELWIGMNDQSSKKDIVIGLIQKYIVKKLFTNLTFQVINTQTKLYKFQIERLGFKVNLLPLFSNIPVTESDNVIIDQDSKKIILPNRYFVIFGSIHHGAPIDLFLQELKANLDENNEAETYSLVAIGRNGSEINNWVNKCDEYGFHVYKLGEQDKKAISHVLLNATFGLITTPYTLIEKSGSFAAKKLHKLPVICVSRPWKPRKINDTWKSSGAIEFKKGILSSYLNNEITIEQKPAESINAIVISFLKALKI